jgi:glycerol-3-phosphate acyltransferase PlsY
MKREDQQDATIRCLLLTSVSTCFGHHYAHLREKKGPVTAFGVLLWFCWLWLVVVVGRCFVGCEQCVIFTKFYSKNKLENQLLYIKRTSAQSIYSRVRLHVSTSG